MTHLSDRGIRAILECLTLHVLRRLVATQSGRDHISRHPGLRIDTERGVHLARDLTRRDQLREMDRTRLDAHIGLIVVLVSRDEEV